MIPINNARKNIAKAKVIEHENRGNGYMVKEKYSCIGQKFGRLTVIERAEDAVNPDESKSVRYKCKCDCGNEKIVRKFHLVSGATVSCGCFYKEKRYGKRTHGFSHKERLYSLWLNIKDRCYNPNNNRYSSYGGRGITICDEWKNDYVSFRNWCMSNGYREEIRDSGRNNLTIDRINVDGNYEPDNCRFITNKENCLNKRNTMSDDERYKICPVCGKKFTVSRRNEKQTCGVECGQKIRKYKIWGIEIKSDAKSRKEFQENICNESRA